MTLLDKLTPERKKLILHRITRAIAEKLQREDIVALYSFVYLDATLHRRHNDQLGPQSLREAVQINSNMAVEMLTNIQKRCGFEWTDIVAGVLREEGVPEPTSEEVVMVALQLIARA